MNEPQNEGCGKRLGKTRTWWHPLLVQLMKHLLGDAYEIVEEVTVGRMPLKMDVLLIRHESGVVPEIGQKDLSILLPLLNQFTFIEFKGPSDSLRSGDIAYLFGCVFLWHSQQSDSIPANEISLIILAPSRTKAEHEEIRCLGWHIHEHEPGIYRVSGSPFTTWLIETDVMADRGESILSLFSSVFLDDRKRIIGQLQGTGHAAILAFVLQQVQQFRRYGEGFAMQHTDTQQMGQLEEELLTSIMQAAPIEKRLEGLSAEDVLHSVPIEKRLEGLSPEEVLRTYSHEEELLNSIVQAAPIEKRLEGLSPEQLMASLTDAQAARLRELLERKAQG